MRLLNLSENSYTLEAPRKVLFVHAAGRMDARCEVSPNKHFCFGDQENMAQGRLHIQPKSIGDSPKVAHRGHRLQQGLFSLVLFVFPRQLQNQAWQRDKRDWRYKGQNRQRQ